MDTQDAAAPEANASFTDFCRLAGNAIRKNAVYEPGSSEDLLREVIAQQVEYSSSPYASTHALPAAHG